MIFFYIILANTKMSKKSTPSDNITLKSCLHNGDILQARELINQGVKPDNFSQHDFDMILDDCSTDNPADFSETLKLMLDLSLITEECGTLTIEFTCRNKIPKVSKSSNIYKLVKLLRSTRRVANSIDRYDNDSEISYYCWTRVQIFVLGNSMITKKYYIHLDIIRNEIERHSSQFIFASYLDDNQISSLLEVLYGQELNFD